MKKVISILALVSISSTAFAAQLVECSIKNDLINRKTEKFEGVGVFKISDSRSLSVMVDDQLVRIELNRPANQDEVASAYRLEGRTITEMPIAYTEVKTSEMAPYAILMAEGTKIICDKK